MTSVNEGVVLLSKDQAAQYLGIPERVLWANVEAGRVRVYYLGPKGGVVRFSRTDLDECKAAGVIRRVEPKRGGRRGPDRKPWLRKSSGRLYVTVNGRQMPYDRYLESLGRHPEIIPTDAERIDVGWVYFVDAPEVERIKIGHSEGHPKVRLGSLQTNAPVDLVTLGILRGTVSFERAIQDRFLALRWKREWFRSDRQLRSFIVTFASPVSVVDEVTDISMTVDEEDALFEKTMGRIDLWIKSNP
jgi:hypothetical protein